MNRETHLLQVAEEYREAKQYVEASWTEWCVGGLHPEASREQFESMRTAFFSGAMFMYAQIYRISEGEGSTAEELAWLQSVHNEINTFAGEVLMENPEGCA